MAGSAWRSGLAAAALWAAAGAAAALEPQAGSPAVSCLRDDTPLRCELQASQPLQFPRSAMRADKRHGTVLARTDFTGPSEPPQVTVLYEEGGPAFADALRRHLASSRLPCLAEAQQLSSVEAFQFQMEGLPPLAFPDMGLPEFLSLVDEASKDGAQFDFSEMGCPFDVTLRLYRPWAANGVRERGPADARRAGFVAWLRGVSLTLPKSAAGRLLGQDLKLSVPCTQLDLR